MECIYKNRNSLQYYNTLNLNKLEKKHYIVNDSNLQIKQLSKLYFREKYCVVNFLTDNNTISVVLTKFLTISYIVKIKPIERRSLQFLQFIFRILFDN